MNSIFSMKLYHTVMKRLLGIFVVFFLMLAQAVFAIPLGAEWISDKNGCKVINPRPAPNETIIWTGKCKNGFVDGEGTLEWYKDGKKIYQSEGNWQLGRRIGKGVEQWSDGDRYEGDWKDDKKNGKGFYQWSHGDRYEGDFKDGKMDGKGVFQWANGERYEGDWKDDKRTGKGTHKGIDGKIQRGIWKDSAYIGPDPEDMNQYKSSETPSSSSSSSESSEEQVRRQEREERESEEREREREREKREAWNLVFSCRANCQGFSENGPTSYQDSPKARCLDQCQNLIP